MKGSHNAFVTQKTKTYLAGLSVALKDPEPSIRGTKAAYGPPGLTSTSKNCVSGGSDEPLWPQTGVIHQSLALAPARKRARMSCGSGVEFFFWGGGEEEKGRWASE